MLWHRHISNTDGVELRELQALVAVVRNRSFTAAAAELGYTQSAVSQQIAALERSVGQQLVCRRPVAPTAAGERLAEHASRVLLRLQVAESELGRLVGARDELRVGVTPLAASEVLAVALRALRRTQPALRVVVEAIGAPGALDAVAAGTLDAALVAGIAGIDEPLQLADAGLFASLALAEDPYVLALPTAHPLARRSRVDLASVRDAPFVYLPEDIDGRGELSRLTGFAAPPQRSGAGPDSATICALVAGGLGLALVPDHPFFAQPGIVTVRVSAPPIVHRSELLSLRRPGPALAALSEALAAASRAPAR